MEISSSYFVLACAILPISLGNVNIPAEYYVEATMTMPYYGLVEPITAYYSDLTGLGRLDYWEGIDRYIYNASGVAYQIVPTSTDGVHSEETCFISGEYSDPISLFPDMTFFPEDPDEDTDCQVRGISCVSYTLSSPTYNDTSGFDGNYTLKVSKDDGTPLQFHFTGFNVILGSHYDEYIFDYLLVDSLDKHLTETTFTPPTNAECVVLETDDVSGDDGGPTRTDFLSRVEDGMVAVVEDIAAMMPCPMARARKTERFMEFAKIHRPDGFNSDKEMFHRASLYHATERYVNAMNRQRRSFWLGLNHMADWTKEERKQLLGRLHTPEGTSFPASFTHESSKTELPDSVDWVAAGAVTPPKDQGTCGSCWSYGTTGTIEGQLFLKSQKLTPLSQQNLMDCSWSEGNNACDGGLDTRAYEWMLKSNSGNLATEESYPYMNSDGFCRSSTTTIGATISAYANITDGVAGLNDALATVGPISVSVDAAPDSFYFYQGGLYYDEECKSGLSDLDHTVLAVGYGSTSSGVMYTTIKNSWSTHWGEGGYIRISQKDNCCGVATQPTYATLA